MIQLAMPLKNIADEIKAKLVDALDGISGNTTQLISNLDELGLRGQYASQKYFLEEIVRTGDLQFSEYNFRQGEAFNLMNQYNLNFQNQIQSSLRKLLSICFLPKLKEILLCLMLWKGDQRLEQQQDKKLSQSLLKSLQKLEKYISISCNTFEKQLKTTALNIKSKEFFDLEPSLLKKIKQEEDCQQITYQLVDEIKQEKWCRAVAFNNQGTIMAASSKKDIKIWHFKKGKLIGTHIVLQGHNDGIRCIVFSKKINWFASSGYDKSIYCWKETSQNKWASSQMTKSHSDSVLCLLLNKNENQLISSSADNTIKVWQVDCNHNKLTHDYTLNQHKASVCCICLNESETSLVSCSLDKSIIIWGKGQLELWEFKYCIAKDIDDFGQRISFIEDNMIAWQQFAQGKTHIFELKDGVYSERSNLQITLNQAGNDSYSLFPSIYNSMRKVLIQKHNKYVYIIKQQIDGKFQVESQPIDCVSENNYGGLTDCGRFLVIWNYETKQFKSYQINYQ